MPDQRQIFDTIKPLLIINVFLLFQVCPSSMCSEGWYKLLSYLFASKSSYNEASLDTCTILGVSPYSGWKTGCFIQIKKCSVLGDLNFSPIDQNKLTHHPELGSPPSDGASPVWNDKFCSLVISFIINTLSFLLQYLFNSHSLPLLFH